jgi:hypothetical protein
MKLTHTELSLMLTLNIVIRLQADTTNTNDICVNNSSNVAQYDVVSSYAGGFDALFQDIPNTQEGVQRRIAEMIAQGCNSTQLQQLRDALIAGPYTHIVSSSLFLHAQTKAEKANYRALYANDLFWDCSSTSILPSFIRSEMEETVKAAQDFGIEMLDHQMLSHLLESLGCIVYARQDGDLDKSWEFYLKHENIMSAIPCVRACYLDNWADTLLNKQNCKRPSAITIRSARTYAEALNKKGIPIERQSSIRMINALSNLK